MSDGLLANLRKNEAVNVYDLNEDQISAWKMATKDNHQKIIAAIGGRSQEIYDAMIKGRDEYRQIVAEGKSP